ncbi:hypothetical protein [Arabiibacter massiliensis]|uniref:hypothetical protein n=1 Tax=Arabiibacter massiliensis TaxID=1870985 RepID=UPI00155A6A93|nr:hypothetical protein [Arabiibacter massiliensis]
MAWGLWAMTAGAALLGATLAVAGVQLARGKWKHVLAGASQLSKRELDGAVEPQTARALGVLLALLGIGVGLIIGFQTWASYKPEDDGTLLIVGIALVLVDLFVVWAVRAARQEVEYNSLMEEREPRADQPSQRR